MGLESFGNNDNYKPIEKKEVNLEAFFEGLKKSNEQISQIRDLEQKDKKQEEQELNIFELYFNGELSDTDLQARLLTISQKEKTQIIDNTSNEKQDDKNEVNETVNKTTETKKTNLELSSEKIKELVEAGKLELQKMGQKNEKINQKIIQLDLILDVSGMYKEYLQSILSNIKLKLLSNKDERYAKQIETIENKIRDINNLIEYINLIGNTDELLNLNVENLLNTLIVSEEKIQDLGYLDHPFIGTNIESVGNVNAGYESIKKMLASSNIKKEDIGSIKTDIFKKLRKFDGLDDDKHIYNTSDAIRTRLSSNIVDNKDLNKDSFVKSSFDLVKNFSEENKKEFYEALNSGKDNFNSFLERVNFFNTLGITNNNDKEKLLKNIFGSLKEGLNSIDNGSLKAIIEKEINSKIKYLETKLENSENKEVIQQKITELKSSLSDSDLNKYLEEIKAEIVFKSFERVVIAETLERKSDLVEKLSSNNSDISLYRDIEGIGDKISDEVFNSISSKTQFIAEQIAIMYASGGVGSLALKGAGTLARTGETVNLFKGGMNLSNTAKLSFNTAVEGSAFYLSYTGLNSIVHKEQTNQLFEDLNSYDAIRTIIFLGVLRAFSNTNGAFTTKNILLDTRNILGTDLIIRSSLGQLLGKEGIPGIDFKNLKASDLKEFGKFITEELYFIIPLVVGLRLSDKTVGQAFKSNKNPSIEIIPRENDYILKIEGVQKEIRILKQNRNIAKNKGKDTTELNQVLKEKKAEYKELRDNLPEDLVNQNLNSEENMNDRLIQENQVHVNKSENSKTKKSNADENTNMNTGIPEEYLRLKKYSKEAQTGKIDYVLKDFDIEGVLTNKGIGKKGESVGEGLLRKSEFSEDFIKDYNEGKIKSEKAEKPYEKEALREMERANEMIYKEYLEGFKKISEGININTVFPSLSNKLINKLEKVYSIDYNILPKKEGKF